MAAVTCNISVTVFMLFTHEFPKYFLFEFATFGKDKIMTYNVAEYVVRGWHLVRPTIP